MYPKHNPYPYRYSSEASTYNLEHNYLDVFKGKPFWIWYEKMHDQLYTRTQGQCCFNHLVGLPKKNSKEYPIFPFQEQIYRALELYPNLSILKSRGIGITTFIIRYLAWKILFNDDLEDKSIFIVSGTRESHSNYIKERMKQLFEFTFPDLNIESKYTELWLKNTWIKCMPSRNVKDIRGYTDAHTIWLDEADFFDQSVQLELMPAITAYQEKSNCNIILTSTPNLPNGLMQRVESDKNFKTIKLDYKVGLGTIYQQTEIDKLKDRPEFQREYCCAFGYGLGNVFLPSEIEQSISPKEHRYNSACITSIGIDPGFGSSKFAITVLQYENSILKVLYAKQWDRPSYEDMINEVTRLRYQYKSTKVYIDGANPDLIKSVKIHINENPDYESVIAQATREKIDPEYRMEIIPVSFSQYGKELLGRFQYFVSKGWFSVPSTCTDLIMDMRTASYLDNGNLDKKAVGSRTFDLLDSTRLALKLFEKSDH
jgi:hypothetical protein